MYLYTKKKTCYPYGNNKSSSEPEETLSRHRKWLLVFLPTHWSDGLVWLETTVTHTVFIWDFSAHYAQWVKNKCRFLGTKHSLPTNSSPEHFYLHGFPLASYEMTLLVFICLCMYSQVNLRVPQEKGRHGVVGALQTPLGFALLYQLHPIDPSKGTTIMNYRITPPHCHMQIHTSSDLLVHTNMFLKIQNRHQPL